MASGENPIRYLRPEPLYNAIKAFDPKYAVTRGEFSIDVPCLIGDMEWNHMDQLHRQFIHNTYQKNLRIALGRDFAVSLTRWGRWPFLITVTDVRAEQGVYYQDLVLAGVIFIHNIITMQETDGVVHLRLEWMIHSHRFLKFTHAVLGRMFLKLNARLQEEDAVIRSQRLKLRKKGYHFRSDPPDYYTANLLTNNTIYPAFGADAAIAVDTLPLGELTPVAVGDVEFLVKRQENEILLWPAACPHEGGELLKGTMEKDCRLQCPWHGLKFTAARLSATAPQTQAYGFEYRLKENAIHVSIKQ